MKGLYQRGQVWWMSFTFKGKQVRRSCETTDKRLAEKIYCKVQTQIAEGKWFDIERKDATFEELSQDLLTDYRLNAKKSIERARISVKKLSVAFVGLLATDISTDKIRVYIEQRHAKGAANATINRELAALKRMFNIARQMAKVTIVPYIPKLPENNVRRGFFMNADYIAVRNVLPFYLKPVATIAYFTGMRKEEILSLQWPQIDLEERKISLWPEDTKTNEQRIIFMTGELLEVILLQKALRDSIYPMCPWVFFREGKKIKGFRKAWIKACITAGVEDRLFHDFRRTGVRNMVRAGVPERVAMKVSGHKTRAVFDRYNIVDENDLRLAAKKVDDHFQSGPIITILSQSADCGINQGTDAARKPLAEVNGNRTHLPDY